MATVDSTSMGSSTTHTVVFSTDTVGHSSMGLNSTVDFSMRMMGSSTAGNTVGSRVRTVSGDMISMGISKNATTRMGTMRGSTSDESSRIQKESRMDEDESRMDEAKEEAKEEEKDEPKEEAMDEAITLAKLSITPTYMVRLSQVSC